MPEAKENPLTEHLRPPKKHKQYRASQYTVADYKKLDYKAQRAVNEACDNGVSYELDPKGKKPATRLPDAAPLVYERYTHPESGRDIIVGSKKPKA